MSTLMKQDRPSLTDLFWSGWPFGAMALDFPERDLMPMRVEEFGEGDTWVIRAELPGVDPDKDVEVSIDGGVLTVSAERREETVEGEEGKPGYRSEFRYGSYRRSLRLPVEVTADDVKATYADGILEVRVPLSAEHPAPAKVPVTRT
jgi:HSP20 family protein